MTNQHELRVRGMDLRHLLTTLIWDADRPMTVDELVRVFGERRIRLKGRPSKTVSDALRWEVGKGRLIRVCRSTYAPGRMPRSTRWWLRRRVNEIVAPTLAD